MKIPIRWRSTVALAVLSMLMIGGLVLTGCGPSGSPVPTTRTQALYHCPMHPAVTSDKPGDCPICGMKLVPIESKGSGGTPVTTAPQKKGMYRSTMNSGEVSDKPGKDSMGMEVVPVEVAVPGPATAAGLAAIPIRPEARERMGLTLGAVERRALSRDVRTSATLLVDETHLLKVTSKVSGWVEVLYVSVTGQAVNRSDPLLTIYSPELVASEQEYLTALTAARGLDRGSDAGARGAKELVAASRQRLALWDISAAQIERLEKTGEAEKTLTLYAPATGAVIEKDVVAGQKIASGDALLVVASLTNVWGDADIYETDLPYVTTGMPVEITLPYWPGEVFKGKVSFLSPTLDPETRTLKARLEIPNPDLRLKPGMYANARLSYSLGERLAVPEQAVMRTGEHDYVFRDDGTGNLVPLDVRIGVRSEGFFEVLSGLKEGDRVVTSANFLVDSESSMKAALDALTRK